MIWFPESMLGAQLSYAPGDFEIYLNYIGGKELEAESLTGKINGHQVDVTATYQVTDKFGLGLNTTTRSSVVQDGETTSWWGGALYANYGFSDKFLLGFRGEYIGDADGCDPGIEGRECTEYDPFG